MQGNPPSQRENLPDTQAQSNSNLVQNTDLFAFLKADEKQFRSTSFFSKNGLSRDIIQVTGAEPDICLEVFYALYNIFWPQGEELSISYKDAWIIFIGGPLRKGIVCPPEKLIRKRSIKDIKRSFSEPEGENQIFKELDQVIDSISFFKQKLMDFDKLLQQQKILASLDLVKTFYQDYRNKMRTLVLTMIEKEEANVSYMAEFHELEDLLEPKAVMMSDSFPHHWAFRISRKKARKILSLSEYGHPIRNDSIEPSNHRVAFLSEKSESSEPLVYFKANGIPSIRPEKGFMLESLYRHFQIPAPETALLILTNVFETNPEYFYAVQASEAIHGESSLKAYQNSETIFNHETYAAQVIGALLTNPSDGSFKNFKYSPKYQTFISIDNDLIFEPELIGEDERKVVNMKSILYLLPHIDLPIPESIKTLFTTFDPHLTIFSWLDDLFKKNREYQTLFTKLAFQRTHCIYQNLSALDISPSLSACLQEKVHVDSELHYDSFEPKILVSHNLLENLRQKLQIIEKILLNNSSTSLQELFEAISPVLGKYYQRLRQNFSYPEEAGAVLWGDERNGVDHSYISSLLDSEEISSLSLNDDSLQEWISPGDLIQELRNKLASSQSPLDKFIRHYHQRRRENVSTLRVALKELQLLIQEGFTDSQSFSEVVDFRYFISKMIDHDRDRSEIISLLSKIPHAEFQWLLILEKYFLRVDQNVSEDLIPFSRAVFGAFMKKRTFLLTKSENQYLLFQKKSSGPRRSSFLCFPKENPEFYLKPYPQWPGYELASTFFMRLFGVARLPYQDFLIIDNCPVLLTQKVSGSPMHRVWQNPRAFSQLDPFHTGLLIISAIILNPKAGREDNFILSQDGRYLIPIYHENWFLPSFFLFETAFWNPFTINVTSQTQTLLFCLEEMKMPIPSEVKNHILSIDFDQLLISWLEELDKFENKIYNLAGKDQQDKFLKQGTVMRISFYKQFIHNIHWKAHKIQKILQTGSQLTPFDLLQAVEPFAAKCYENSFRLNHNPRDRFISTAQEFEKQRGIDGSRIRILDSHTMMEIINKPEDLPYDTIGPLDALEVLKQLIQERLSQAEQKLLCELDGRKPSGLEASLNDFFRNSQTGLFLKGSRLVTRSKLSDLFTQSPSKGVQIRFLSLPESPLLTKNEIRILAEECPNLEYLNVSGCEKLKSFYTQEGEWSLLVRLEARECLNLEKLLSYSPLRVLRIESQHGINMWVEKCPEILTVSKKKNQFELMLKVGQSFEIKSRNQTVSNDDFLLNLIREEENTQKYCKDIHIRIGESSIWSGKHLLALTADINLQNSNIQTEDIKKMIMLNLPNLKRLELPKNKLKGTDYLQYLIQGSWPKLNHLNLCGSEIHDEGLEILAKNNWYLLEVLNLQETKITAAGVETLVKKAKWTQLKSIDISENKISDKVLSTLCQANWPLLETLNLKNTGVTKRALFNFLFTSNFKNLKEVDFGRSGKNLVNSLLQKNWSELGELDLSDCGITQNEIETLVNKCTWPNLKYLNLSNNNLSDEGLEIFVEADCPKLEILNLKKTNITTIGVKVIVDHAKWAQMKHLNLSYNEIDDEGLRILAQGDWPLLETLNLENTAGTKKGLLHLISNPKWANLQELNFSWNGENIAKNLVQKNWHILEELDLSDSKITQNELELIVKKCNWPCLKSLNLSSNSEVNDEAVALLCQGNWPTLETLNLENTEITKKSLLNFLLHANWPNFKTLLLPKWWTDSDAKLASCFVQRDLSQVERLDLNHLKTNFKKVEAILSKNKCLKLKHLNLSDNEIPQEGKETLLGIVECHLLEDLSLRNIQLTSNELEAILHQSNWSHLKHLDISHNQIFDEGFLSLVLAEWPFLENLNLSKTNLSLQGVEAILDLSKWQQLKHLNVSQNELFDEGLSTLSLVDWPHLESLNISQIKCSSKGVEAFLNQSKWLQLKHLDISHNELSDEGISALTLAEWPGLEELNLKNTKITQQGLEVLVKQMKLQNLKKLDISENIIGDEGLKILHSAEWPLFEHLVYYDTQVTIKGHITLLENTKWSNLTHLEHSLNESFCNDDESILAAVPMFYKKEPLMATVLDVNWLHSKEISLTIQYQDLKEKVIILPRNKLNQLESIKLSFDALPKIKPLQSIILPSTLKSLDLSQISLSDHNTLENLVFKNCPLLEDLQLKKTNITTKGIEILFSKTSLPNLKNLNLSQNIIENEGLEVLASASLKMLENIDLEKTEITDKGIDIIVSKSNWPNLKRLNLSRNKIQDKGLEMLCSGKWPLLESLNLQSLDFTEKGIESIINKSEWPNLKTLDLSFNKNILDETSESLAEGKWPLLECLYLDSTNVELKVVETLFKKASWPYLKEISLMDNIEIFDHQDAIKGSIFRKWPNVKLTI